MAYDAHKNFAYSTVATAPSPATSGTSLVVGSGDGAKFPTPPFNATIWPVAVQSTTANAEIVRVTAISIDTLTITRAQESSSARTVVVGDQISATITAKTLTDVETYALQTGAVVQRASTNYGTSATGTTTIPLDDTIPQNTEGDQYMSQAITPKATTNRLLIQVTIFCSFSAAGVDQIAALFQDSTANALAAAAQYDATASARRTITLTHEMAAGTTSATTFKIRIGGANAGTTTFGGTAGGRYFGGATHSNITITETSA